MIKEQCLLLVLKVSIFKPEVLIVKYLSGIASWVFFSFANLFKHNTIIMIISVLLSLWQYSLKLTSIKRYWEVCMKTDWPEVSRAERRPGRCASWPLRSCGGRVQSSRASSLAERRGAPPGVAGSPPRGVATLGPAQPDLAPASHLLARTHDRPLRESRGVSHRTHTLVN